MEGKGRSGNSSYEKASRGEGRGMIYGEGSSKGALVWCTR